MPTREAFRREVDKLKAQGVEINDKTLNQLSLRMSRGQSGLESPPRQASPKASDRNVKRGQQTQAATVKRTKPADTGAKQQQVTPSKQAPVGASSLTPGQDNLKAPPSPTAPAQNVASPPATPTPAPHPTVGDAISHVGTQLGQMLGLSNQPVAAAEGPVFSDPEPSIGDMIMNMMTPGNLAMAGTVGAGVAAPFLLSKMLRGAQAAPRVAPVIPPPGAAVMPGTAVLPPAMTGEALPPQAVLPPPVSGLESPPRPPMRRP